MKSKTKNNRRKIKINKISHAFSLFPFYNKSLKYKIIQCPKGSWIIVQISRHQNFIFQYKSISILTHPILALGIRTHLDSNPYMIYSQFNTDPMGSSTHQDICEHKLCKE